MRRRKLKKSTSRRLFKKSARVHKKNRPTTMRGGYRL